MLPLVATWYRDISKLLHLQLEFLPCSILLVCDVVVFFVLACHWLSIPPCFPSWSNLPLSTRVLYPSTSCSTPWCVVDIKLLLFQANISLTLSLLLNLFTSTRILKHRTFFWGIFLCFFSSLAKKDYIAAYLTHPGCAYLHISTPHPC